MAELQENRARPAGEEASAAAQGKAGGGPVSSDENSRAKYGGIRIRVLTAIMIFLASFVSLMFLQAVQQTNSTYNDLEKASEDYIACASAANDMKDASNYLTSQVRNFVVTGNTRYLNLFFEETQQTQRRDHAMETMESIIGGNGAFIYLDRAMSYSNDLVVDEYYAMKLVVEAKGIALADGSKVLEDVRLSDGDQALSPEGKQERAKEIVFGDEYVGKVNLVETNIVLCREDLIDQFEETLASGSAEMHGLLFQQQLLTWGLLLVTIGVVLAVIFVMLWPLQHYISRIKNNEPLPMTGAHELRYLAGEYNVMYEENLRNHDQLRRKAEHDHLTGLYNRSVFEKLLYAYREEPIALLLVDADYFKNVNDTLGHDGGDAMLQKIAHSLTDTFRSTDYPCRIGGDEFAVIMTEMHSEYANVVLARVKAVTEALKDTSDGLPVMTLSVGVAFSGEGMEAEKLFKHADTALYEVKESGRNGVRFYAGN